MLNLRDVLKLNVLVHDSCIESASVSVNSEANTRRINLVEQCFGNSGQVAL